MVRDECRWLAVVLTLVDLLGVVKGCDHLSEQLYLRVDCSCWSHIGMLQHFPFQPSLYRLISEFYS
jgi:hypothetical protein